MFIHFFFALLLASVSGRMFSHYEIGINICAALPLAVCMDRFCYLLERLAEKSRCVGFKLRMIEELIGIVFGLLILTAIRHDGTIATLKDQFAFLSTHDQNDETLLQYIMDHTVETDPIMVGGMNCKYYIATGRYCNNRRFVQDYDLPTDDTMMREIQEDIDTNPPKLIIFRRKNVDGNPLSGWMLAFEKSMERRVMAGTFREDEDDFFIAFERN